MRRSGFHVDVAVGHRHWLYSQDLNYVGHDLNYVRHDLNYVWQDLNYISIFEKVCDYESVGNFLLALEELGNFFSLKCVPTYSMLKTILYEYERKYERE